MNDKTVNPKAPRGGALATLVRAQWSNREAEAAGNLPAVLMMGVLLVSAVLLAFPFVNDKFTAASRSAEPSRYPGLLEVLVDLAKSGADMRVGAKGLEAGPSTLPEYRSGSWLVLVEPAGAKAEKFAEQGELRDDLSIVWLGTTTLGILCAPTEQEFNGTWQGLGGFDIRLFLGDDPPLALQSVLSVAAMTGMVEGFGAIYGLMILQMAMLSLIMGFLLSLSRIRIQGTGLGELRGVGFAASWKTVSAVALGPALLLAVVFYVLEGLGGMAWLVFSVLYAGRVVMLYMGRFRNKKKNKA